MPTYRDRVRETSVSTGTTAVTLAGAVEGYQSFFDAYGNVAGIRYSIADGTDWENGIGTLSGGNTLARNTVTSSSNGGSLVNFAAGDKDVFSGLPAADAELIGLIEISDDAGATSDPARMLIVGSGLSLSLAGDEATIEVPSSGTGPSGGSLISGYEVYVHAGDVGGASNGAGLTNWPDQSANNYDFAEATNPPTYRSADADDGLPYVEFDGTNDVLEAIRTAGLVAQTDLTVYFVMRWNVQSSTKTPVSFSENGENSSTGIRPYWQVGTAGHPTLTYNSVSYNFAGVPEHIQSTDWAAVAMRLDDRMSRPILTWIQGGQKRNTDLVSALPTLDFDRMRLGALYGNFGAASQFCRVDFRAFALYLSAHTDVQMRSMLGFLRDTWLADLLTHNP